MKHELIETVDQLRVGDTLNYAGEKWIVERIDPDKTWWQNFGEWISGNQTETFIVVRNYNRSYERIYFNKETFNDSRKNPIQTS